LPGLPLNPGPTDWPMYQKDLLNSGSINVPGWTGELNRCAEIQLSSGTDSIPIVVGDYLFLQVGDKAQARNRFTGALIWESTIGVASTSSVTYDNGRLFFFQRYGGLWALDANTGTLLWNISPVGPINTNTSSPVVIDDVLYVLAKGQLAAVQVADGVVLWQLTLGPYLRSSPAYYEGVLYFGTSDERVIGVDIMTQSIVMNITLPLSISIWASPTISEGILYIATESGRFYAISLATQNVIWDYLPSIGMISYSHSGLAVQGDLLAYTSDARGIFFLDKNTGLEICSPHSTDDNFAQMNAIIVEGDVMTSGCDGGTFLVDVDTCSLLLEDDDFPCAIWGSLVAKDGWVYGIDTCGKLDIWCPVIHSLTQTPTFTTTQTPTMSSTVTLTYTPSPTYSHTMTPTETPSTTLSWTPSPTITNTSTLTPTLTVSSTLTSTPTETTTLSVTPTLTPTCEAASPNLTVKVVMDPETRDELTINTIADEPIDCSNAYLVLVPHSYPKEPITITGLTNVDNLTCEVPFSRFDKTSSGFGDIDTITAHLLDGCGNLTVSDGSFDREIISDKSVLIIHNRINPLKRGDETTIQYQLSSSSPVEIKIFNSYGEIIRTLVDERSESGIFQVKWDGRNEQGQIVASAIYFVTVVSNEFNVREKILVIK